MLNTAKNLVHESAAHPNPVNPVKKRPIGRTERTGSCSGRSSTFQQMPKIHGRLLRPYACHRDAMEVYRTIMN
jgi:hypothetical protein